MYCTIANNKRVVSWLLQIAINCFKLLPPNELLDVSWTQHTIGVVLANPQIWGLSCLFCKADIAAGQSLIIRQVPDFPFNVQLSPKMIMYFLSKQSHHKWNIYLTKIQYYKNPVNKKQFRYKYKAFNMASITKINRMYCYNGLMDKFFRLKNSSPHI